MLLILNHLMEVLLQLNVSPYLHHHFLSCLSPFLQKIINQFYRSFYPFQYILCIFLRKKSCEWLYNCGYVCAVAAHLTGIHSAIKMLNSRIRVLHHYLLAMQKGVCLFCLFRNLNLFKVVEERIGFSLRKNIEERTKSSGERNPKDTSKSNIKGGCKHSQEHPPNSQKLFLPGFRLLAGLGTNSKEKSILLLTEVGTVWKFLHHHF